MQINKTYLKSKCILNKKVFRNDISKLQRKQLASELPVQTYIKDYRISFTLCHEIAFSPAILATSSEDPNWFSWEKNPKSS